MQYTDKQIEDVIVRMVSTWSTLELISYVEEDLREYYLNNCSNEEIELFMKENG